MTGFAKAFTPFVAIGILASSGFAQAPASSRDAKAITRVKSTLTSQLEAGMPKITLEYFLKSEAGPKARLSWEVNDCGEQTGDPATDAGRDIPVCVEADAALSDGRVISVMVAVGSVKNGTNAEARLFSVFVSGAKDPISQLSQIPAALHRTPGRWPRRQIRDVPSVPTGPGAP